MPHASLPIMCRWTHIVTLLSQTEAYLHTLELGFTVGKVKVLLWYKYTGIVSSGECT